MALTLTTEGMTAPDIAPQAPPELAIDPNDVFGMEPPDFRDDHEKAMDTWRQESAVALDAAVLDPKSYGDERIPHGYTPDEWRKTRVVDDWMRLHSDGQDPPMGPLREFERGRLAQQAFGGAGADSDESLFTEITGKAQSRKDARDLTQNLHSQAFTAAVLGGAGEKASSFAEWKEQASKMPGYDAANEGNYYLEWHNAQLESKTRLEPVAGQLKEVWQAMKAGGAGSPSEIIKSVGADLLLGGGADGEDTIDEIKKKDAGALAFEHYNQLDEEGRAAFSDGLHTIIQQFPKEQRPALLATWGKTFGGVVDEWARGAASRFTMKGLEEYLNQGIADSAGPWGASESDKAEASKRADTLHSESLAQKDFMKAVRSMERDEYAPTKFYSAPSDDVFSMRTLESGFYGSAAAVASVAVMATPYVGYPTLALAMEDFAYNDLRANAIRSGSSEGEASEFADDYKTIAAVPQLAAEIIQNKLALGKIPAIRNVLTRIGDKVTNRIVRGAVTTAAFAAAETGVEEVQYLTPYVVQDLAAAFEADTGIQAAEWSNGKNGALDGFWTRQATTFISMLPMGIGGAAGGLNREARNEAFRKVSPLELRAYGLNEESIANIQNAPGPSSLAVAIDKGIEGRDPNSPEALAAVEKLKTRVEQTRRASTLLEEIGYSMPAITAMPDGSFIVRDNLTGEEVGRATTTAELDSVVRGHTVAMESMQEDEMRQLATWLGAAKIAAKDSGIAQELNLSRRFGMQDVEEMGPAAVERFMAEVALQEQAEGGDGSATRAVFGYNLTETRDGVKQMTNRIFQGANIGTLFHENWHGARKQAKAAGNLTREDDIRFLRAFDAVLKGRQTREVKAEDGSTLAPGTRESFLPDGMADADISETHLDEAIAEVAEVLTFLFPRNHTTNKHGLTRKLVSTYLGTVGRLAPEATRKFSGFIRAIRAKMGLAMSRAYHVKKAIAKGELDPAEIDSYMGKLFGTDEQAEHDDGVRAELGRIFNQEEDVEDDNIPFAVGRSNERLDGNGNPQGIDTNFPGGANIGDAAQPGKNAVTPEIDAAYLDAANKRDKSKAEDIFMDAALMHPPAIPRDFMQAWEIGKSTVGMSDEEAVISGKAPAWVFDFGFEINEFYEAGRREEVPEFVVGWRRGDIPEIGRSRNHADNTAEPGVSLAYAHKRDDMELNAMTMLGVSGRKKTFVQGWSFPKSRWGSDGEIVILSAQKLEPIKKESGSVIPLSSRFNQSTPADSGAFSIGRAEVASRMQGGALSLVRDPIRRVQAMSRVARDFGDLSLSFQRIEAMAGRRMSKGQLRQEANAREDMAADEKIGAVWARYGSLLADDDLTRIKSQPVHEYLSVKRADGSPDPLHGRIMSKVQAMKRYPERYALHRGGEYDGADNISRSIYGGQLMPDQAAQELFDAGLISEPYTDAMWEALEREQNSVIKNKEALAKALEEIREAKREAKREASEWLATQGKEQETAYNPKQEILASLRMLDAILLALPPEIRGKIGGYTQMAMIATDEARLAFLKDKLKKADKELETFLRESFNTEWLDLLKRAKPDKDNPGQRPIGQIDADALDILRAAESAMWLDFSKGEAEADRLDALAEHEDTKPEDADKLRATAQMVRLTTNWSSGDAARREQAVIEGTRIYYGGLMALRVKNSARAERLRGLQTSAKQGTGQAGDRMDRKKMQRKEKAGRAGQAGRLVWEFLSFGQLTNVLFGESSAVAKWFNAKEIAASNAYEDGVQAKAEAIESMFESLSGSRFNGEKLRHRMQTKEAIQTKDSHGNEHTFTEAEGISFLLMWRQEDGKRHMEGQIDDEGNLVSEWGWTEQAATDIESQLTPEAKSMMAFLGTSYGEEYGRINDVFRRIWNVSMPRHKFYAPLTVKPSMGKQDAIVDPVSGDSMGVGMTPGSLKNRSQTAVTEPDFRDAFQVFLTHARQMEHFISYAEFARDAMAVVNRREIRNSIEAVSPTAATALGKWVDYFALGGLREAAAGGAWQQFFAGALSRLSSAALVGRVSVLGMQTLQLGAAAYKMPLGAYLSRFARLMGGRLAWGDALRSDYIQRRMLEMPPVVRDAVMGLAAGTPNRAKYLATKAARGIAGADGLFTAGTYAILYDYHLTQARKAGIPNPESHAHAEAERLTDQVAQPMRTGARSWLEISMQNQPAFRALWNFSTDPRQKISLVAYAALRHDVSGKDKAAAVGKAVAVTWAVSGILQAVLRSVFRDLRNDDDDELFDERHWDLKRLGLMASIGPIGGIPYLGGMIESSIYNAAGEWKPANGLLDALSSSVPAVKRLATLESDDVLKDIESVLSGGAVLSGTSAAGASAMHAVRDAVNTYENFDED